MTPSEIDLAALQAQAEADGRRPVVGALILDRRGRVFIQRRGPDRAYLPNGWDLVGGHVEAGEALIGALKREVAEETGWLVVGTPQLAFVGDWWTDAADASTSRREFDFLVDVDGDRDRPRLEWPKHTEFRWIDADGVAVIDENRGRDDGLVRHLAELALRSAVPEGLSYPHSTLLLGGEMADPIERLRRRWDPAMASQISAHVTVTDPSEVASMVELVDRVQAAAERVGPFELRLRSIIRRGGRHAWVGVELEDADGGWQRLRELIVPASERSDVRPHVTIVHPRHSNLGEQAWRAVRGTELSGAIAVREVTITAFDGRVWRSVERVRT